MSLSPADRGLKSLIVKIAGYSAMAAFIFALQIGLPSVSVLAGGKLPKIVDEAIPGTWMWFVSSRLCMERLFHPRPRTMENFECISSAIYGDELLVLLAGPKGKAKDYVEPFQLLRCDLRSGSISVSKAPPGVRYLLSDGKTLWQLPAYTEKTIPFLWERKPSAIARYSKDRSLRCLIVFNEGNWVETDRFAPKLCGISMTNSSSEPTIEVCPVNDQVITLLHSSRRVLFRTSLELGSEAAARTSAKQNQRSMGFFGFFGINGQGWNDCHLLPVAQTKGPLGTRTHFTSDRTLIRENPLPHLCWRDNQLFMLQACQSWNSVFHQEPGFQYINLEETEDELPLAATQLKIPADKLQRVKVGHNVSYFVPSPILWDSKEAFSTKRTLANTLISATGISGSLASSRGKLCVTTSVDGRTYVLNYCRADGRKVVLESKDAQMHFVGQIGCAIDRMSYVDLGIAFVVVFGIPMLVLAIVVWIIERWGGTLTYQTAHETTELASIVRRGIARMIDLALIAVIVIWSIVSHPAALTWWQLVMRGPEKLGLQSIKWGITWNSLQQLVLALQDHAVTCLAAPLNWWIIAIALTVLLAQILVQGRTGRTLGKWITGIRVVRTTLRPCGIARSVLREIMVLVDGLLFVSWVPGTIAALTTAHRQRLGDLMADTIVVVKGTVVGVASNIEPNDVLINE